MKIKKPSLKGMKHTKYLGHFAQDKYIRDGHNFSGSMPLFREPSQIEMMSAGNPFDAAAELKRREQQVASEVATLRAQTPNNTAEMAAIQSEIDKTNAAIARGERFGAGIGPRALTDTLATQQKQLELAKSRSRAGREASYRANRKKFLTEV